MNEIARDEARSLIRLLPNPDHHSKVEFEDLVCRTTVPSGCSFKTPGSKEPEKRIPFTEAPSQGVVELLQRLGRALPKDASGAAGLQIDQGHCVPEKSTCKIGVK
jgi:hypothetical protein